MAGGLGPGRGELGGEGGVGVTYIACEHYDFEWEPTELERFRRLWKNGEDIRDIAAKLRRKPAEVAF